MSFAWISFKSIEPDGTLYEEEEADQDINDESDVEDDEEFDMNLSYEWMSHSNSIGIDESH